MCASKAKTTAQIIRDRQLFTRNLFKHKSAQERDWLLAKVKRNPEDARSVFFLAETYFRMEDFVNARKWYARRVEMGGCDEEVYYAMYRLAESMSQLGEPWPDVEDAYLRGLAVSTDPRRAAACHRLSVSRRAALPARVTCLPSAPPKSHFPKRTSLSPEISDSLRLARNR